MFRCSEWKDTSLYLLSTVANEPTISAKIFSTLRHVEYRRNFGFSWCYHHYFFLELASGRVFADGSMSSKKCCFLHMCHVSALTLEHEIGVCVNENTHVHFAMFVNQVCLGTRKSFLFGHKQMWKVKCPQRMRSFTMFNLRFWHDTQHTQAC